MVLGSSQGRVHLRYTARCSSCGGCGGRCQVFVESAEAEVEIADPGFDLREGQSVELEVPAPLLLRQAAWGYGLPLCGLIGGAAVLSSLGDAAAAAGAVLGTSLAVAYSKRAVGRLPAPRIRAVADAP